MKYLQIGDSCPNFVLKNQEGKDVSLLALFEHSSLVVVYFYPKASTPGCTVQACGIRDYKTQWDKARVTILGISPDPVKKIKTFHEKQNLNFDLLSDETQEVAKNFGVWGPKKFMGRSYEGILRTTFVLEKKGKKIVIKDLMTEVKTGTHAEELQELLEKFL